MKSRVITLVFLVCLVSACNDDFYKPKPVSYFRIDFPKKKFEKTSLPIPCEFSKPVLTFVEQKSKSGDQFNLVYPLNKAKLHFTYFDLEGRDLAVFFEDAYNYAYTHNLKANAITSTYYNIDSSKVYGLVYDLKGDVASPVQFYATDSTNHFLRGALYFSHIPNADSVQPVIDYIKYDVDQLFQTLRWEH